MEKYFFKNDKRFKDICIESCEIKPNFKIGSLMCQYCENCLEKDDSKNIKWIKCKFLNNSKNN